MPQNPDAGLKGAELRASERARSGLRGSVRSVEEETIYPASRTSDGSEFQQVRIWHKTEYDMEGRIVAFYTRDSASGGGNYGAEWVRRYIYSPAGSLLKVTLTKGGEVVSETVYHYDAEGRLESATDSSTPGNPVGFRYDSDGRKTRVATVPHTEGGDEGRAVLMSFEAFFESPERTPTLPDGGTAITLYDTKDRPTEVQLRDSAGTVVRRAVRVYDERGYVVEEQVKMEDPLTLIPAKHRKEILANSGLSQDDLRAQIANLLGTAGQMQSSRYEYDKDGRRTVEIHKLVNHEQRRETSYNAQGDAAREIERWVESPPQSGQPEGVRSSSELVYTYEYDGRGNWTLRKGASRVLPDGALTESTEVHRTIEYY